jgi:aldehyde dehydrogenase (NAD+)
MSRIGSSRSWRKRSGNGREYAEFGIDDYLELKAVVGYG